MGNPRTVFIIIISMVLGQVVCQAAGIRDEIFYLNKNNYLEIVDDHFKQLPAGAVPELIAILQESLINRPIQTISGSYKVSSIAQGEIILKLAEFADQRAKDIIENYLKQSLDRFDREAAAVALGSFGDPGSIPLLKEALSDRDPVLQLYAARSLGELKDTSGYEIALKYLRGENKTLKIQSMYALALIGKSEAVSLLREQQKDPSYSEVATLAIKKIEFDHLAADKRPGFLNQVLKNNKGEVAYWAAGEYFKLGADYVPRLQKIAENKSYKARETVAEMLQERGLAPTTKK